MRINLGTRILLVVAVVSLPLVAKAQKFQEPTKAELEMTSDPKAPGAPAVFLYREEVTDNANHFISEYARIKVLTELGKEWATVEVPYIAGASTVPIIEGRTIHSDGAIVPLVGKASDLLVFRAGGTRVNAAVFNLPSVEVGSILEYKWTVPMTGLLTSDGNVSTTLGDSAWAGQLPDWDVQKKIYVHKGHFYFNPYSNLASGGFFRPKAGLGYIFTQRLPSGSHVIESQNGDFTLDIQDVPAIYQEADAPPLDSTRYMVTFYSTNFRTSAVFWDNEGQRWSKELDQFASQSTTVRDAATQIIAGAHTEDEKARKLYDAVQDLENTDFARTKTEAERKVLRLKHELKKVQDVWKEKSGTGDDLAALYLALARSAGLRADGLKVVDRSKRVFDPNYLSLDQLDDLLVVLHLEGHDLYLDPGQKLCPFGQLHWKHSLAGGIMQNAKAPIYTPPNLTKDAITAHAADLTLDPTGEMNGTVKVVMNGPMALHWRQLNLTTDAGEVEKQLIVSLRDSLPQGVSAEIEKIQGLDTSVGYLSATVKVSGTIGSKTRKRILVPAFFFSTGPQARFVSGEKREMPIDLHYTEQIIDDVIYHLPAGYTVESAPQPAQLPWPDHAALVIKTQPGPGNIDIKHIFARAFVLLEPKEYPALRDYYQKIATTDTQQVVLAPTPGTAGN